MFQLSAVELHTRYKEKKLSPVEFTEQLLKRTETLNTSLNAFRLIDHENAISQAEQSHKRWREGNPLGPLDGIPISIKDIVNVKSQSCLSGSHASSSTPAVRDCPAVERLREAGAILFGLTHTPEFGWKGITDSPRFGITRNPWNTDHSPGGSSGGAGAAVAAGLGPLAHGTDAGGSVRIPSSYCGLFGIKPTYGRVPHAPNDSPYSTLASTGPLSRTVSDAALMLNVISQPDSRDWRSAADQKLDYLEGLEGSIAGVKIAYSPDLGGAEATPEILEYMDKALDKLRKLGAVVEVTDSIFDPLRPVFEDYWKAGFAYILKQIPKDKWDQLDPGFRKLAEQGFSVDLDSYYAAESGRVKLGAKVNTLFDEYDLLITPTMASTAPRADIIYHSEDFDRWRDATPYTLPFNLTGHPAASIPIGIAQNGLPVGMQIVGARFDEKTILRLARAYEKVSDHSERLNTLIESLT
ncbi:MAG: amidase [Sneathiellales bacterium]|nr:amidase [Sneathiellales bacterium]